MKRNLSVLEPILKFRFKGRPRRRGRRLEQSLSALSLLLAFCLIVLPMQSVAAKGLQDGPVIFGGTYTLESGETLNDNIIVFGGMVMIEEDALVKGDVVLFGGNLTIDGEVRGDVALIGGAAVLGESAVVDGDLNLISATMQRADGAEIRGETTYSESGNFHPPILPHIPGAPDFPFGERALFRGNPLWVGLRILGRTLAFSLLALLMGLFLAEPTKRVGQAITSQMPISGGLGLLTIFLSPFVVLILLITVILAPVAILAIFVLMVALLYGWIALGFEVGMRFTKMMRQEWQPPLTAAFGTAVLTLISASFNLLPCLGGLVTFLLATLGLGGVLVSRFGTQAVVVAAQPVAAPAAPPIEEGDVVEE